MLTLLRNGLTRLRVVIIRTADNIYCYTIDGYKSIEGSNDPPICSHISHSIDKFPVSIINICFITFQRQKNIF